MIYIPGNQLLVSVTEPFGIQETVSNYGLLYGQHTVPLTIMLSKIQQTFDITTFDKTALCFSFKLKENKNIITKKKRISRLIQ